MRSTLEEYLKFARDDYVRDVKNHSPVMGEALLFNLLYQRRLIDDLQEFAERRYDLEERVRRDYSDIFGEIFSKVNIEAEVIPIYQVKPGEDNRFENFRRNKYTTGFYSMEDGVAVLRSTIVKSYELITSVHEMLHHNLKLYRSKERIRERDSFVEEGLTEFLTSLVMGDDYWRTEFLTSLLIMVDKVIERGGTYAYVMGRDTFRKIYDKLGIEGVFEAYKESQSAEDLMRFMFRNKIFLDS